MNKIFVWVLAASAALSSCSKQETDTFGGPVEISVSLKGSEYADQSTGNKYGQVASTQKITKKLANNQYMQVIVKERGSSMKDKIQKLASTNVIHSDIEEGTRYRLLVFRDDKNYITHKDYTVGEESTEPLNLDAGTRVNFVIISYGKEVLPAANYTGSTFDNISFESVNGQDVMLQKIENYTLKAGANNLSATLKHVFTKISLKLNSAVGPIQSIGEATLAGSGLYNNAATTLASSGTYPYSVAFTTPTNSVEMGGFTITNAGNTATLAEDQIVYVDNANEEKQTISISSLSINTTLSGEVTKEKLSIPEVSLEKSKHYDITVNITAFNPDMLSPEFDPDNIDLDPESDIFWAKGNLILEDGEYKFAENQTIIGNHWIYNWLIPMGSNTLQDYQIAEQIGGKYTPENDPCSKVAVNPGASKWRTPSIADYEKIFVERTGTTDRYKVFAGELDGVGGVYFGISSAAEINNKVMFLPYGGTRASWQSAPSPSYTDGWYQSSDLNDANNYLGLQIRSDVADWGLAQFIKQTNYIMSATPIRCVRDKY